MNKKVFIIFLIFFVSFININNVHATSCAEATEKVDLYHSYVDQLNELDCTDNTDEENVKTCNDLNMKKNMIVTELMKIYYDENSCGSAKASVREIVTENEDVCGKVLSDELLNWTNRIMIFFYVVGPVLLIVLGTLDYTKATVSSDPELIRRANKRFIRRLIATILLFMTPMIVNLVISLNVSDYYLSGNAYSCDYDYLVFNKQYTLKYIPKLTNNSSLTSAYSSKNGYTLFKQGDPQWSNERLLCSSTYTIGGSGCALSSIAMHIVNSGVETTETINPSSLNKIMKNNGDCSGAEMIWNETSYATNNNFIQVDQNQYKYLTGNISDKASQLADYLSQGYYPVIQVKCEPGRSGCSHYVAVFYVENGNIYIGNPATGELENLNASSYKIATDTYSSQLILYQAIGGTSNKQNSNNSSSNSSNSGNIQKFNGL